MEEKKILLEEIKSMSIQDEKVLEAIKKVPRENFVGEKYKKYAYANYPLPIPAGQTISQPYTVAFMVQLLDLKKGHKVLEIGAGSGYNAAVMAEIVNKKGEIHSLEINEKLVDFAKKNLDQTRINNVNVINYDGSGGYPEQAPYDRIIVTANSPEIPEPLFEQLKEGGTMVIPVKSVMTKVTKEKGEMKVVEYGGFSFVPLKGRYGYR